MANSYSSLCDDFFVDMHINTELDLPGNRDTVLHFFERIQRQFPSMGNFFRKDNGDFCLEEDRSVESYRRVILELDRICCGCANPAQMEQAFELNSLILDISPYMLGVSHLDIDSLDLTFTMDFDYQGNHDEIIAEALYTPTAFSDLLNMPESRPIGFSPSVMVALTEDCRTQLRLSVESRSSVYEIRNNKYKSEEPISLYFTIRRYPRPDEKFDAVVSHNEQWGLAENLMADKIIPNFVQPLVSTIAQRRK